MHLCIHLGLGGYHALVSAPALQARLIKTALRIQQLRLVAVHLQTQGCHMMFDAAAILAHMRNLLFKTRHFGIGFIQHALTGMQRVARLVMIRAQRFEAIFRFAQFSGFGFELGAGALDFPGVADAGRRGFFAPRKPQQALQRIQFVLQLVILLRDLGLALQMLELLGELLPNVIYPQQILARVTQP